MSACIKYFKQHNRKLNSFFVRFSLEFVEGGVCKICILTSKGIEYLGHMQYNFWHLLTAEAEWSVRPVGAISEFTSVPNMALSAVTENETWPILSRGYA